jgi:fucose 4-O-acetylase-like acetyltransferase
MLALLIVPFMIFAVVVLIFCSDFGEIRKEMDFDIQDTLAGVLAFLLIGVFSVFFAYHFFKTIL